MSVSARGPLKEVFMPRTMIVPAAVAAVALLGSAQAEDIHGRAVHHTRWHVAHQMSPLGLTGGAPVYNAVSSSARFA